MALDYRLMALENRLMALENRLMALDYRLMALSVVNVRAKKATVCDKNSGQRLYRAGDIELTG